MRPAIRHAVRRPEPEVDNRAELGRSVLRPYKLVAAISLEMIFDAAA